MLPNIRTVLGTIVVAVALLAMSFAIVATFRVAQETRIGVLQADLVQRGRSLIPASEEPRLGVPAENPAPLEANPVAVVEVQEAPEISKPAPEAPVAVAPAAPEVEPRVTDLPVTELTISDLLAREVPTITPPSAEPPTGGPLVQDTLKRSRQPVPKAKDEMAARRAKKKAEQAAAKKAEQAAARKARAQRLARERKAAARKARAALARAKQQPASSFDNAPLGNSFGTFNNGTSANRPVPNGTFGNGPFGTYAPGR